MVSQRRIPGPPIPLVSALRFMTDTFKYPLMWYHQYGNLVNINAAHGGAIVAFGADHNRHIFTNTADFHTIDANTFPFKLPANTALYRQWNNGLLQMNGERHDQQRRLMMPAFHKKRIEHYRALIIEEAEKRLGTWRTTQTRHILYEMRDLTAAIAMRAFLGIDPDTEGAQLHQIFPRWTKMMQSPVTIALPLDIPTSPFHRLLKLSEEVEQALTALLSQKRAALSNADAQDGLSALIHAQDEDGTRLTDNEIMGQIGTFYVAGHETTASALTWALFLLAQHPAVYAKLEEALRPLDGNAPTPEQADQIPLLDWVIKQTLRLFPPLPFIVRSARVPFTIGGVDLPSKVGVVLSPFVTHRIPKLYPQPAKFLPERWEQLSPSPYEYIPFGAGSRMCLGATFAMAEMKIILPMIIGRFRLASLPNANVDYTASIFVAPRNGLPMQLHAHDGTFPHTDVLGNIHSVLEF